MCDGAWLRSVKREAEVVQLADEQRRSTATSSGSLRWHLFHLSLCQTECWEKAEARLFMKSHVTNFHPRIQSINQYLIWVTNSPSWQEEGCPEQQLELPHYLPAGLHRSCFLKAFKNTLGCARAWKCVRRWIIPPAVSIFRWKIYKGRQTNCCGCWGGGCSCHRCSGPLLNAAADYINWLPVATLTQQCRVSNDIFFFFFFFFVTTAVYLWRCQLTWTWVLCVWSFFSLTESVIPSSPGTSIPVNIVPSPYRRLLPRIHPPPAAALPLREDKLHLFRF